MIDLKFLKQNISIPLKLIMTSHKPAPVDISFMPGGLKLNEDETHWYFKNQRSTYEMVSYIMPDNESTKKVNDIVKNDPEKYGTYAGLNDWSPYFTDQQLINFHALCHQ